MFIWVFNKTNIYVVINIIFFFSFFSFFGGRRGVNDGLHFLLRYDKSKNELLWLPLLCYEFRFPELLRPEKYIHNNNKWMQICQMNYDTKVENGETLVEHYLSINQKYYWSFLEFTPFITSFVVLTSNNLAKCQVRKRRFFFFQIFIVSFVTV